MSDGADFVRVGRELQDARSAEGGPYQNTVPLVVKNYFLSALSFGGTATSQLLQSGPALSSIDLVLEVPAVTPLTGTPAWNPGPYAIVNLQMLSGGKVFCNLTGQQIYQINRSRASINGLQSLEICDLTGQTLAQRQAAAAAPFKFIIHLPCPCDDGPIPYSKFSSPIQVQVQLASVNNILEAGTGTCLLSNAYLECTFLTSPVGVPNLDVEMMQAAEAAPNGIDRPIRDHYYMQYSLGAGTTSATLQLNQLRNFVGLMTFFLVPTASLQTPGNYKPEDYLDITTFQMVLGGLNVYSQQPVDADVHRRRYLPRSGFLNFTDQKIYGIGFEGGIDGSDQAPIDVPYGGGLYVGPSGKGSPELQITYPALAADTTCFVLVEAWNALRYTSAGNGMINMTEVLN